MAATFRLMIRMLLVVIREIIKDCLSKPSQLRAKRIELVLYPANANCRLHPPIFDDFMVPFDYNCVGYFRQGLKFQICKSFSSKKYSYLKIRADFLPSQILNAQNHSCSVVFQLFFFTLLCSALLKEFITHTQMGSTQAG